MRTLLAAVDELHAVLEELAGNLKDLLNLVGHCGSAGELAQRRFVKIAIDESRELGGGKREGWCR